MTFWGELTNGEELLLGEPLEVSLIWDEDAPASQLQVRFPADRMWEDVQNVRVFHEGEILFGGIVDEQNTRVSRQGFSVELVCRSWEALLLDNEALPGVLQTPTLKRIWERFCKPLGFQEIRGDMKSCTGQWTVEKGVSCWEVLESFCRELGAPAPFSDGGRILWCCEPSPSHRTLEQPLWGEVSRLPCHQLSAVWQQSFRGQYDTPFRNPLAPGVHRERYVSMEDRRDPRELIREGERESRILTVECQGLVWPQRGEILTVPLGPLGTISSCKARSVRYTRDSGGQRTRLVLERSGELCG